MFVVALGTLGLVSACSPIDSEGHREDREHHDRDRKPSAAALERGRGLYKANCAPCHGDGGKGDGPGAGVLKPPPRDHTDRVYMRTLTDEEIAKVIKMGGAIKGKPLMPSHPQFKDEDLEALVAYTRSLSAGGG